MNSLPLHPAVVHLPLALAALAPLSGAALLLAWWRGWLPRRAWWLQVVFHAAMALSGMLAMRTGDTDAELVESRVPEAAIEAHEHAAELFVQASGLLFVVVLAVALIRSERVARLAALGTLGAGLVVLSLAVRTGEAGGELVFRHGAAQVFVERSATKALIAPRNRRRGEDDDADRSR